MAQYWPSVSKSLSLVTIAAFTARAVAIHATLTMTKAGARKDFSKPGLLKRDGF